MVPRYDSSLSLAERSGHENGIWCCAKHGRMIDNDTVSYTVAQLRSWKTDAIDLQRRAHSTGDIDPNGRVKLMRATGNEVATRAVKAAMKCRAAIMTGIALADSVKRISRSPSSELFAINQAVKQWGEEITRASTEATEAVMDVMVNWGLRSGEPPGLTALIVLAGYLEEWRSKFTEAMQRIAGLPFTPRKNFGPCDWTAVFNGDVEQCELLQKAIDDVSARVDEWAESYIVSRET